MNETKTAPVPMFYIEYYKPKTEKLVDISEEGYATLEASNRYTFVWRGSVEKNKAKLEQKIQSVLQDIDTVRDVPYWANALEE